MKRVSEEEKEMWLEDWKQSGKSAWTYAKENGLPPQTFINWTKPEKEIGKDIVEVTRQAMLPEHHQTEILIEKGDVKIHIPLALDRAGLRAVMEGLGGAL